MGSSPSKSSSPQPRQTTTTRQEWRGTHDSGAPSHTPSYASAPVPVVGVPVSAPPKFITDGSGVRRLNPEYVKVTRVGVPTGINTGEALPVCCNMQELGCLPAAEPAQSVVATTEIMCDADIAVQVGATGETAMQQLGGIFAKYETPMGLVNKLLCLMDFQGLEFIVDDSGSMYGSRWREVQTRLKEMCEILAHVPCPPITIRFLNRAEVITMVHPPNEPPQTFARRAMDTIDRHFTVNSPSGGTPALERIDESLRRYPGQAICRYFFGDGVPNGGATAAARITQLLVHRYEPNRNPFTFISCTDNDDDTQWMKDAEEAAPFCSEYDDFETECKEVRNDQGEAFPYTRGFHLIGQLVGALCPDDLDCLDESVPLTRDTLANILGYQLHEQEYRHYFTRFETAQRHNHRERTALAEAKRSMVWSQHYDDFVRAPVARSILAVTQYVDRLRQLTLRKH